MARKLRLPILALGVAALTAATALAQTTGADVHVKPRRGTPTTRFVVTFRAPDSAGTDGSMNRRYEVSASNSSGSGSCLSSAFKTVTNAAAGSTVSVTWTPGSPNGRWCLGVFHGRVEETQGPVCQPLELCPEFATTIRQIGTFKFRVHRRSL